MGKVFVDTSCERFMEAPATPRLRAWFLKLCPRGEASAQPECADFAAFVRAVAVNNQQYREACRGAR